MSNWAKFKFCLSPIWTILCGSQTNIGEVQETVLFVAAIVKKDKSLFSWMPVKKVCLAGC